MFGSIEGRLLAYETQIYFYLILDDHLYLQFSVAYPQDVINTTQNRFKIVKYRKVSICDFKRLFIRQSKLKSKK